MTRPAPETDATKGSASNALSQRATGKVDTLTRRGDPFASRHSVTSALRYTRSRDENTSPSDAIDTAVANDELVALPRPETGDPCLTVRDGRRLAMCHTRYADAGESHNADVCRALLESGLPAVHPAGYVSGP